MYATQHHPAHAWNQVHRRRDPDDARGRPDYVNDVIDPAACSDGIPMSVECPHRNRNSRLQAKLLGPIWRKCSSDLIRGGALAIELLANTGKQWIDFGEKLFGG